MTRDFLVCKPGKTRAARRQRRRLVGRYRDALCGLAAEYPERLGASHPRDRVQNAMRARAATLLGDLALWACENGRKVPSRRYGGKRVLIARGGRCNPMRTVMDVFRRLQGTTVLENLCTVGFHTYFVTLPHQVLSPDTGIEDAARARSRLVHRLRHMFRKRLRDVGVIGGFAHTDTAMLFVDGKPHLYVHAHIVVVTSKVLSLLPMMKRFWTRWQLHDLPPGLKVHLARGAGKRRSGNQLKNMFLYAGGTCWRNGARVPKLFAVSGEQYDPIDRACGVMAHRRIFALCFAYATNDVREVCFFGLLSGRSAKGKIWRRQLSLRARRRCA